MNESMLHLWQRAKHSIFIERASACLRSKQPPRPPPHHHFHHYHHLHYPPATNWGKKTKTKTKLKNKNKTKQKRQTPKNSHALNKLNRIMVKELEGICLLKCWFSGGECLISYTLLGEKKKVCSVFFPLQTPTASIWQSWCCLADYSIQTAGTGDSKALLP